MGPPLCAAHTAAAYSAVSGGYSLFPWLLTKPVISAHPTAQSPRGPIHPNETQRHFTPKKLRLTLTGPTLALGIHAPGSRRASEDLEKLFPFVGRNGLFKKAKIPGVLMPILNLSPSLLIEETWVRASHLPFTMCFGSLGDSAVMSPGNILGKTLK